MGFIPTINWVAANVVNMNNTRQRREEERKRQEYQGQKKRENQETDN